MNLFCSALGFHYLCLILFCARFSLSLPSMIRFSDYSKHVYAYDATGKKLRAEYHTPIQPYKYNGKELDRHHGLDWYDYGARWYDGIRFSTMDRFAEKYPELSPYSYCAGNPIKYIDVNGDSISSDIKYQGILNSILEKSFGDKASQFTYTKLNNLVFNGDVSSFSKEEKVAYNSLKSLMISKKQYKFIVENSFDIITKDGKRLTIDTGNSGTHGDAAVYPTATFDGVGIIGLNPNTTEAHVLDVTYTKEGNQIPLNINDLVLNNGQGPLRTFAIYENFWHAIGHLLGGPKNQGKAMDVKNQGGKIHKMVIGGNKKTYIPSPISPKPYNANHPKY